MEQTCTLHLQVKRMKHEELSACQGQLQTAVREVSSQLLSGARTPAFDVSLMPVGASLVCSMRLQFQTHDDAISAAGVADRIAEFAEETVSTQAGTKKRSWQLLERVLSRTCAAWQSVEGEQQQLARLQKECKVLQTELAC